MTTKLSLDFEVHQEEDLVASRRVLTVGVLAVVIGAVGVFFAGLIVACDTGALQPSFAGPHGPRAARPQISHVEQTPIRDAERGVDLRNAQRRKLETWGWVDRDSGVATIPIETAIDIIVRETSR
jgi:hypothetical protein